MSGLTLTVEKEAFADYLDQVRRFPLIHIADDSQLAAAMIVIDRLTEKSVLSAGEEVYLGALTDLVERFEDAHVVIPPRTGVDALRFLMEENGLKQADLAAVLGRRSVVSEILHHKRRLALSHITKLAAYFYVSPATFIDDTSLL